ncbi:MAG TPA: ABC transporter permease [Nocardioidaceae bacterium]|nr:ABC transporter permease [Nocardioidaceae bacterium]
MSLDTQTGAQPGERDEDAGLTEAAAPAIEQRRVVGWRDVIIPAICLVVALLLYFSVHNRSLDTIESNILDGKTLTGNTVQQIYLSLIIAALVICIAVPLGILVTRRRTRWLSPIVLGFGNLGQSAPSLGLLAIFGTFLFIGFWAVIIILTAYTTLSVLRNTIVGLEGVDRNVLDAAKGMGMSPAKILLTVELPLAIPVIGAGARTAIVLAVGTVPLAADLGAGGLGASLFGAIHNNRPFPLLIVAAMIAILALLMDWAAGIVQRGLTPRGIR